MLNARRVIAVCLLLGWLFAIGHVTMEHGSAVERDVHHELTGHHDDHDHGHHDDGEQEEEDHHHHHDLLALAGGPFLKTAAHDALAPVLVPLHRALLERLTVIEKEARKPVGVFDFGDSPPDGRASGWLLVVQTALQVRGPSLV